MIWSDVEIVRAGAAALEVLEALHGACFAVGWDATAIARLMAMPGTTATLAVTKAIPAGFLLGREAAGEAEIISTGVLPEFRGRGIGGALVSEFAARMRERCAMEIFLEVAVNNEPALSLYKRLGFVAAGLRKAYYEPALPGDGAIDALIMRRQL